MSEERLNKKVIIVTGGNGLIGTQIVQHCKENGALVINADISLTTDLNIGTFHCDLTNVSSVENLIDTVVKTYGRIDGLVNNAYPRTSDWGNKFEDISFESWQKNVDMQLNFTFLLCQKVAAIMKNQKMGSIVNLGSIYGIVGNDFSLYEDFGGTSPAAYSAIKGGIINFTRYLASYFGPYNVRVNCVSPGGIIDQQHPSFIQKYESKVPMKRMGKPEEIAPAITFLLSEEASYITGHNLVIDGGWTAI